MKTNPSFRFVLVLAAEVLLTFAGVPSAAADSSHARIVRLSYAQGDVRFARSPGSDSLTDPNVVWEAAALNLPIRQGYVLGTGSGRAAVEFEYGNTAAYLDENTVLEFSDLSLSDGVRSTRLVLRQGTGSFIVAPAGGEYFSVTAGQTTVKVEEGGNFRVDVYDEGVTIGVKLGRITLITKSETTSLVGGQSVTVRNGETAQLQVQALPARDDFDEWVSDTQDSLTAAYTSTSQYVSSPNYSYGFADLYTYGYWFGCPGYPFFYCWRPFGVGIGWCPFHRGRFLRVPRLGLVWVSRERWGWLPYHHGGWLFSPVHGWMWSPGPGGRGGIGAWRPFTGTWVRSGGQMGVVPLHPMDANGRTPLNLIHGVIAAAEVESTATPPVAAGGAHGWRVVKSPPSQMIHLEETTRKGPPERVFRTLVARGEGARFVNVGRDSTIVYDPVERKFVNVEPRATRGGEVRADDPRAINANRAGTPASPQGGSARASSEHGVVLMHPPYSGRVPANQAPVPGAFPHAAPPPARTSAPPAAPRTGAAPHPSNPHPSSGSSSRGSSSSGSRSSGSSGGGRH